MNDKEKTKELYQRLCIRDITRRFNIQHLFATEMPYHCGFGNNSRRRADLFSISIENNPIVTTYEIKVSRQDFLKELKQPNKQDFARLFSHYFFYVTPIGLLDVKEIPLYAGLIEIDIEKQIIIDEYGDSNITFIFKKDSPRLEPMPPTWGLVVSAIRHSIGRTGGRKENIEEIQQHFGGSVVIYKERPDHRKMYFNSEDLK